MQSRALCCHCTASRMPKSSQAQHQQAAGLQRVQMLIAAAQHKAAALILLPGTLVQPVVAVATHAAAAADDDGQARCPGGGQLINDGLWHAAPSGEQAAAGGRGGR